MTLSRVWAAVVVMVALAMFASPAMAQGAREEVKKIRVAVTEVPIGGTDLLLEELRSVEQLDVRDHSWFASQVRGRGFQIDGIVDRPNDLRWVMNGGSIDYIVSVTNNREGTGFVARFIHAENATAQRTVQVDRMPEGLSPAGAAFLRLEMERLIGAAPSSQPVSQATAGGEDPSAAGEQAGPSGGVGGQLDAEDPEVVRQRAAAERQAIVDRLKRDWLWARANFRMMGKDTVVAGTGTDAVYSYTSAMFPGFELDVEAYPFVLSNPELVAAGMYASYVHGFDRVRLASEDGSEVVVAINHFAVEGGAIYRLDSPLGQTSSVTNQQIRLKLGVRYEASSADELIQLEVFDHAAVPSTSMVSVVVGTRLNFPVLVDGFALAANLEIVPISFFGAGHEIFGQTSRSYGFSADLGMVYEVIPGLGLTAGYSFSMARTGFQGQGAHDGEANGFIESDGFQLLQGLRAGVVYQY